jgi:putative transcriptional regulator
MPIVVRIDVELARRKMSVGEFSERVGLTPANVAVLKNGRAKAVRFSTLEAMCRVGRTTPPACSCWASSSSWPRLFSACGRPGARPGPRRSSSSACRPSVNPAATVVGSG